MARVVAFVPDLLFGSNVVGSLKAAGHDVVLAGDIETLRRELPGTDVVVVDLTAEAPSRLRELGPVDELGARSLAFYSHVEADVRVLADQAGFDVVVPRSRMAREGAALVTKLGSNIP